MKIGLNCTRRISRNEKTIKMIVNSGRWIFAARALRGLIVKLTYEARTVLGGII